jgi:membrane-associated phospholipid phosphatase
MRKFTTIILFCSIFTALSSNISAQNADIEVLKSINGNTSTIGVSKAISNSTTYISLGIPVVMGAVALLGKDDDLLKNAIYVGVSLGVDGVLTLGIKEIVRRPRPVTTYPNVIIAYENEKSMSFPSGHTSLAFATATALSLKYPKWYVIAPTYLWACSVGYSRMNLGVHYPSDVLGGAILGAGSAYLTYQVNQWFWKKHDTKKLLGLQAYL